MHKIIILRINSGVSGEGVLGFFTSGIYEAYEICVRQIFQGKIVSLVFKFIVRNTNNYELQKTTTMHSNTVHTHMIKIITKQKMK